MFRYVFWITSLLKGALDFILQKTSLSSSSVPETSDQELISRVEYSESGESVECPVCLCQIVGGEEIGELRCGHLFHGVCMDRWLSFKHSTCPLCRDCLVPSTTFTPYGAQVILFKFYSFGPGDGDTDTDTWWLR
ncbi:RING-H2 finger protein ATL13-like [Tripterygium wilfordii]|uniref:RING-H2 finger protein ATL13-like n=1 Tax=Tripterygium wilfordii TaxID=458696 RepID=A0A7J7E0B4_TRIWF|nr:E3 ubiquitin-protein ligase RHA2B-like [Tripterygium wilfordii]KAF5751969.1 RING-H2 finger protein ATL13-like [Tripterygium wilfordii]